mgnify:CR=1 FL=1
MSQFIVGVTGGIGSGKSEVMRRFQAQGIEAFDADDMARVVVEPGRPALDDIVKKLGPDMLTAQGELNRPALRALVFSNPKVKRWLEQRLHPLINQELEQRLARAQSPYALLVSPLLFESEQNQLVDRVLVVDAPRELQLARASRRDNSDPQQIEAIIDSQMSREARLSRANDVVDNAAGRAELDQQVGKLHNRYLTLCNANSHD